MRKKVVKIDPAHRQAVLEERRRLKMARSAHAYVRGNTLQFYEWLNAARRQTPPGPAHLDLRRLPRRQPRPRRQRRRQVEIEIRDLDQTVIGNPAHDLIRLGLSLATAARGSDLPGVTTALMMEQMVNGYQDALKSRRTKKAPKNSGNLRPIEAVLQQATKREWRHLAQERIEDVKPNIPLGRTLLGLSKKRRPRSRSSSTPNPSASSSPRSSIATTTLRSASSTPRIG